MLMKANFNCIKVDRIGIKYTKICIYISSVQFSHSVVSDSVTPWIVALQAFLSITNFQSLLKLMSIKLVMSPNHLILCCPLLLPPSISFV